MRKKQEKKETTKSTKKLPMTAKMKRAMAVYIAMVLIMTAGASTVFAADDPLTVINNLSTFIFGLIRAIGMILLGFGIVQVGLSLKSHDPSQRANGFLTLAGGVIITFMENIKLALQSYNYGNGYLEWAKARGGYTLANAAEFSDMMAQRMGWSSYGDKQYVPHVLQYYAFGRIPTGIGNQAIVQVAASQEGKGGTTYWSWYGFGGRVEWCACFVSWCADQSGYIQSGVIPKFSLCSDGVKWFESKGRFRDASYTPAAGDIIFFDWGNNGTIDHVGIVESVSGGTVNTIEGNSGDKVARRSYSIGSSNIYGYGVPAY